MQELTSTKLEAMGIFSEMKSMIIFQGKKFSRGPSFSLRNRAIGISFCEREERRGYNFLLVESAVSVTVWKEIKTTIEISNSSFIELDKRNFIACCRQELTKCIGPMASLIIDELISDLELTTPTQFLERIEAQIPDSKLVTEFRSNIMSACNLESF